MEKMNTYKLWKQDPSKGEVFTPIIIVNKKLNKIPERVWRNPNSIFCDLSMGKGTYLIEIVNRLVNVYGYTEEDAKTRVFGYDIRVKYVNYLKRRGYKNVFHRDSLEEKFIMKFDVVLGNPPYQKQVGPSKTEPIWQKFVEKSFEICKEDGYVSLIHPNGWRNVDGKFKETQKLILSKNIKHLNMNSPSDGVSMFQAQIAFDYYLIQNNNSNTGPTIINDYNGNECTISIKDVEFIPNSNLNLVYSLVANENEEKVEIISDSSYHTQRDHMFKERTDEFRFPCVYTVKTNNELTFWYSNTDDKGHYGVPKVIWGNGASYGVVTDENGQYGLTQFTYGIVDKRENLPLIKKVLQSKYFIENVMGYYGGTTLIIFNRKILSTFRKDFWKAFLDDDGNIIEPNFENDVERV